jgi:hypothetical protein
LDLKVAQLHCMRQRERQHGLLRRAESGAPVLKVEPNLFGGFDVRDRDVKIERCEKTASGETECRVMQESRDAR